MKTLEQIKSNMIQTLEPSFLKCNSSISVYDFNAFTVQELICQLFTKMNEVISQCNTYTGLVTDVLNWIQNEGLKDEVNRVLETWKNDGTIDNIINHNIFNSLNSEIEGLKNKDTEIENSITEQVNTLTFKDTELQSEITKNQKELSDTRIEMNDKPQLKVFTLKNQDNELVPDSIFSDEELSTMRVETYFIKVQYRNPFPEEYKPGAVFGQCFALGNNKWDVRVKDVTNYGFSFCLVDSTTGEKVNNSDPVNAIYATYVSFIHASSKRVQVKEV